MYNYAWTWMKLHSKIGVPVQAPLCLAPGINQNATSVRLTVSNHGAVDSEKIGDKKEEKIKSSNSAVVLHLCTYIHICIQIRIYLYIYVHIC
jgi:hypothetical protein